MKKGVFSMYASKNRKPAFYINEYSYPNHKEAEAGFYISEIVSHEVSNSMKDCIYGIAHMVVKRSCTTKARKGR